MFYLACVALSAIEVIIIIMIKWAFTAAHLPTITRAVLRLVWLSILLQSARGHVATTAAMECHVRKTA